jgi:hypothetical protein
LRRKVREDDMTDHDGIRDIAATDDALDPRDAAALLEQTTRRAKREFEIRTPLLMVLGAALVLVDYGGIWLSVRGQDPYVGPSGTTLVLLYSFVFAGIAVTAIVARRSINGIGGRSSRERQAQGIAFGTVWVLVYVFAGALDAAGAGPAIVYGIYPAAGPLIIVGSAAAGYEAAQEHWGWVALTLAVVALGALAAYSGPVNVWGVIGAGFSLLLLLRAASLIWTWRRHQ